MSKPNKGPGYSQCPGVPSLNYICTRRVRLRKICPECERAIQVGRMVRVHRCPGVPEIKYKCTKRVKTRDRCRLCQVRLEQYQAGVFKNTKKIKIDRWCLKCDKKFVATNRFTRICKCCRENNRSPELNGLDDTRYSISFGNRR